MKLFTNDPGDKKELKKFAYVMTIAFGLVFGIIIPLILRKPFPHWPHYIWPELLILSFMYPPALTLAYLPWMKLGHALGYVNSRIILGVVFFFLFTPISLMRKMFGKDPLFRFFQKEIPTYRELPPEEAKNNNMLRPF